MIKTKPEEEVPANGIKGVRKTWLEGYCRVNEFYSPDYLEQPLEEDLPPDIVLAAGANDRRPGDMPRYASSITVVAAVSASRSMFWMTADA